MKKIWILFLIAFTLVACTDKKENNDSALDALSWSEIEKLAQGESVTFVMWTGDSKINAYMQNYIIPKAKKEHDITIQIVSGQGPAIVQTILTEIEASQNSSEFDMMWINGETFYQLRQIDGLYGPWTDKLPNAEKIDFANPFIGKDFQQPVQGYELPWGNVQMTLIYNSAKVKNLPKTKDELFSFVKANPGTFTIDNQFTGLTFLKALLIDFAGGKGSLKGDFDEAKYKKHSAQLWQYLRKLKPYLWQKGETFPEGVAQMHQLFASGELYFTMSNNDAEVESKTAEGLFPETARAYVPDFGTIQNSHYIGISKLSRKKPAAMVVANMMVSVEAQLKKLDPLVWGDGTVLDISKLDEKEKAQYLNMPKRMKAPDRKVIQEKALQEIAPEYMIRLAEDFRKEIIMK